MQLIEKAPKWKYVFSCWHCKDKLEANEDDLVYVRTYPIEGTGQYFGYAVYCPYCNNPTEISKEEIIDPIKEVVQAKGLYNMVGREKLDETDLHR